MAEPKVKSEAYNLLGGMNIKASKYVTAPTEFLDLQNMNFNRPNSLTSRDGSTNYCGIDGNPCGISLGLITGLHEYAELTGFSMMVLAGMSYMVGYGAFGSSIFVTNIRSATFPVPLMDMETFVNHLFFCNGQVMQKYSVSFGLQDYTLPPGLTLFPDTLGGGLESYPGAPQWTGVFGFAYGYLNDRGYLGPAISYAYFDMTPGQGVRVSGLTTPSGYGITAIAVYMTDPNSTEFFPAPTAFLPAGVTFFYTSQFVEPFPDPLIQNQFPLGLTGLLYIPDGVNSLTLGPLFMGGVSLNIPATLSITLPTYLGAGVTALYGQKSTGIFGFAAGFVGIGGLQAATLGPITSVSLFNLQIGFIAGFSIPIVSGPTGIIGIQLFMTQPCSAFTLIGGITLPCAPGFYGASLYQVGNPSAFIGEVNYTARATLLISGPIPGTDVQVPDSVNMLDTGLIPAPQALFFTLIPKYLEIYQNSMFLSGISGQLSNVFFSDPGEPESIQPTNFFEVRTNDGDQVRGMKAYGAKMAIAKRKSFHLLTGSSSENYYLREVSTEYGCLSHRAMAVFEDTLLFLDEKGIALFDGQSCRIISNKIEAVFKNMNVAQALDNAVAIHNRPENQVIFAFPSSNPYGGTGGTQDQNNTIVVYDYLVNAFTVYHGIWPAALLIGKGQFANDTLFVATYGTASPMSPIGQTFAPMLQFTSASIMTDLFGFGGLLASGGVTGIAGGISQLITGISCTWTGPFHNPFGHSTECQFRRLYSDFDVTGSTVLCSIGLFSDFGFAPGGSNVPYGATFYTIMLSQFQTRLDFGIPGKALAIQWNAVSSSGCPINFNGYAIDGRVQRLV